MLTFRFTMPPASEECKEFQQLEGAFIKAVAECHRLQGLKRESAINDLEFTLLDLELAVKWKNFTREELFAHLLYHGCSSVLGVIHPIRAIPAKASG